MIAIPHASAMVPADDERIGRLLRLLRHRERLTQRQLAAAARVPRGDLMAIEAGRLGSVSLDRTRRIFGALGARPRMTVWWNGAAADRLLDEHHAALVEYVTRLLTHRAWQAQPEVSFSEYGERGSIDILALRANGRAAAVIEVKSDIGSLEETNRVLDAKVRLAPKVVDARTGWRPAVVGKILVLPDEDRLRRLVDRHRETMRSLYPDQGRETRAWLRMPDRPLRAIWFLSKVAHRDLIDR